MRSSATRWIVVQDKPFGLAARGEAKPVAQCVGASEFGKDVR